MSQTHSFQRTGFQPVSQERHSRRRQVLRMLQAGAGDTSRPHSCAAIRRLERHRQCDGALRTLPLREVAFGSERQHGATSRAHCSQVPEAHIHARRQASHD